MSSYTKGELSDVVKGVLREAGVPQIIENIEALNAKQTETLDAPPPKASEESLKTGEKVGRIMRALVAGKGDARRGAEFARRHWGDDITAKALESGDEVAGGFLVQEEYGDLIELLYPASVVRASGARTVPMTGGTLRMPKITAGSSGSWIGENQNIVPSEPTFGQIMLTARKYASLVPISNDLLRRNTQSADQIVRDDLVTDIATGTDLAFLRGSGVNGEPNGLENQGVSTPVNATVNVDNVTTDLASVFQRMGDANISLTTPGWIMEWRTWRYLTTLRDTNANYMFKAEMDAGTLFGVPYKLSSQIPRNLGTGSDETIIYFADFAHVIIADTMQVALDVSDTAAYHDGSNVVAPFSLDQTVIRAIVEVDIGVRHDDAVQMLTGVDWGA